jgi:glutaredoxin
LGWIASMLLLAGCATNGRSPASARDLDKPIIVYTTATCDSCMRLTDHLRRRGVVHLEKDVAAMPGAREEVVEKLERAGRAGAGPPVMDFRGEIFVGYDPVKVDALVDEDDAARTRQRLRARANGQ